MKETRRVCERIDSPDKNGYFDTSISMRITDVSYTKKLYESWGSALLAELFHQGWDCEKTFWYAWDNRFKKGFRVDWTNKSIV